MKSSLSFGPILPEEKPLNFLAGRTILSETLTSLLPIELTVFAKKLAVPIQSVANSLYTLYS